MKVKELIKLLKSVPEETEVHLYDQEYTEYPFTIMVDRKTPFVSLHISILTPDEDYRADW